MPDLPGKPQHNPACMDETMMKWMMATFAGKKNEPYVTALRSSSPLWVIPIAKAGERVVVQPAKSTR